MTLEQAYKKVHMMDKVLDSDILNDEEYTSVAKRRFKLMEQIGLEEQRQKQLATHKPKLCDSGSQVPLHHREAENYPSCYWGF